MMQAAREIEGVSGVHVMAYRQEELVAEIVDESGVLKGRRPWRKEVRADDAAVAERLVEILTEADALPEALEQLAETGAD